MRLPPLRDLFFNRRSAALALVGFASGTPYIVLGTPVLSTYLTEAGSSKEAIAASALLLLPYSFKVLWAPLADSLMPPGPRGMGRRRRWIAWSQIAAACSCVALAGVIAATDAESSLLPLVFAFGLLIAFSSATQDVSADAYRADVSPPEARAAAASVFVLGYRVALAGLGAGALIMGGRLSGMFGVSSGWSLVFAALGLVMLASIAIAWFAPEPPGDRPDAAPLGERLRTGVVAPFVELSARLGARLPLVLLFVILFKLPDTLPQPLTVAFLKEHCGYTTEFIGVARQAIGLGVTIVGAIAGGLLVPLLGLRRSLILFSVIQAATTGAFALLAQYAAPGAAWHEDRLALSLVIVIEYLGAGLVTAGFVAFLMSLCEHRHSATQYALLTAAMTLGAAFAGAASGPLFAWLRESSGGDPAAAWSRFFIVSALIGAPGLALVRFVAPRDAAPRRG